LLISPSLGHLLGLNDAGVSVSGQERL